MLTLSGSKPFYYPRPHMLGVRHKEDGLHSNVDPHCMASEQSFFHLCHSPELTLDHVPALRASENSLTKEILHGNNTCSYAPCISCHSQQTGTNVNFTKVRGYNMDICSTRFYLTMAMDVRPLVNH
jgi:hypothetical protein